MGDPLIEIKDVCFSYDGQHNILRNINLKVYEGDFIALIGKNGCGKTTLSKHLNGILRPSSGTVQVCGKNTKHSPVSELASTVGYCYQNPDHQIFNNTIKSEVEFGPKNIGMTDEQIAQKITAALEIVGLDKPLDSYPFSLSKGERQKLAVASILAMETPVMVVDEPSTGMDWRGSIAMMNLMRKLNERGHTMLIITHDMRFVAQYAKRVIAMSDGEIIADTTPTEILGQEAILKKANLSPPQITRFMRKLNLQSDQVILDIGEAVDVTVNMLKYAAVKKGRDIQ